MPVRYVKQLVEANNGWGGCHTVKYVKLLAANIPISIIYVLSPNTPRQNIII